MTTPQQYGSPIQIPVDYGAAVQVWSANQGMATLINQDTVNTVYASYGTGASGLQVGQGIPIPPLSSITVPGGSSATFAIAPSDTAALVVVPGSVSYSPGGLAIVGSPTVSISGTVDVDITGQSETLDVSVSGSADVEITGQSINVAIDPALGYIPTGLTGELYRLPSGPVTINPGGSWSTPMLSSANYSAYDVVIGAYCSSQNNPGAPLVFPVTLTWYDENGTQEIGTPEVWWGWVVNSSPSARLFGSGQMRAANFTLSVTLDSSVTTQPIVLDIAQFYGSSRVQLASDWRQAAPLNGALNAGLNMLGTVTAVEPNGFDLNLISLYTVTIPANQTVWQPLPLFAGPCSAIVAVAGNNLAHDFVIAQSGSIDVNAVGLINGDVQAGTSTKGLLMDLSGATSSGSQMVSFTAPQAPMYFVVATAASTTSNITISIVGQRLN